MSDGFRLVESLYEIGKRHWEKTWDAVTEELDFSDGKHFAVDEDEHAKDRRQLQFKGQELYNVIRHKSAQVTAWPRHVEARPIDREVDPPTAELATYLIEWETGNPLKLFDDYCDIMVTGAIAARYWLMAIDFDPFVGPWGEIVFRPLDPRNTMWEPGYHSPHDIACGWFIETRRPTLAWVRSQKGWNTEGVGPDSDTTEPRQTRSEEFPGDTGAEKKVTLRFLWLKHDRTTVDVDTDYQDFPEDGRYLSCESCGWKSEPGAEWPEKDVCPKCGMPVERVDGAAGTETRRLYPDGRRLVVTAPNSGSTEPLYDGPWTIKGLRSFPVMMLSCYLHPSKPVGPSDTLLNWSGQLMADLLMTTAGQRVLEFRNYYLMPEVGINDWSGKRFEFRDDQFNSLYYKEGLMPANVQVLQGSALDPSWRIYWQATRETLLSNQGISDLGLGPQDSKDIAASTVQQLTQMGEIPVEQLKRRYHRELGRGYGLIWDFIRATYTPARLSRLHIADMDALVNIAGDELPNYDFVITDGAGLMGLDKSRAEAMMMLIQAAQLPPEAAFELMADPMRMPPSVVRRVREAMAKAKAEQQQMMQMQMQAQQEQAGMQQEQAAQQMQMREAEGQQKLAMREREGEQKLRFGALQNIVKMAGGLTANSAQGGNGASAPRGTKGSPASRK